jgi:hypothetical protein
MMITRYNNLSLLLGVPGFLLQAAGNVLYMGNQVPTGDPSTRALGQVALLVGTVLLLIGLVYYAKAKGRSPWWCLLAFLSLIGLIALACLEDRSRGSKVIKAKFADDE